ncbi:MAG: hypothetical protein LBK75_06655 [Oscillospiraceae bacterium]|jgi:hypothetical protein|nr:hypothetical protein [Oscillospiraceae bacterium]
MSYIHIRFSDVQKANVDLYMIYRRLQIMGDSLELLARQLLPELASREDIAAGFQNIQTSLNSILLKINRLHHLTDMAVSSYEQTESGLREYSGAAAPTEPASE